MWETLEGVWPCVSTVLCVDNIVLGGWLTERTWRPEIIQCQVLRGPDRNTEGVTLVWNLSLVLQAASCLERYVHAQHYLSPCISQNLRHPSCTFMKKLPKPFILRLFCFLKSLNSLTPPGWFPRKTDTDLHYLINLITSKVPEILFSSFKAALTTNII